MHSSKVCFKCGTLKPLSDFYKHSMMSGGHLNKCKTCAKFDVTANRLKNIDRIRKYDRDRAKNPDRARNAAAISTKWRQRDKRLTAAHNAVTRAVRKGVLDRKACEKCGADKSYAHHEDYNRPLIVVWLCQPCHKARHKEMAILGIDPLHDDVAG